MIKVPRIVKVKAKNPKHKKDAKKFENIMNAYLDIHKEQLRDEILKRICGYGIRKA